MKNKAYYSEEHGYVCDCRPSYEKYEDLCWICQERIEEEDEEADD